MILFSKKRYARADLEAAALALGQRGRAALVEDKKAFKVTLSPAKLEREFAGVALNSAYRRRLSAFHAPLTSASLSWLLSKRFPVSAADPLEELEPQVREDREAEIARLASEAERA